MQGMHQFFTKADSGHIEAPWHLFRIMAGLVPASRLVSRSNVPGRRDKPGDDTRM
jgi:hypothetical protein